MIYVISTCKTCREIIAYKASGGPMTTRSGYWFHLVGGAGHQPELSRLAKIRAGLRELFG